MIHISIRHPPRWPAIQFVFSIARNIQLCANLGPRLARVGINSEMVSRRWRRCDSTCCQPAKVSKPARSAAMSHIRAEAAEDDSGTAGWRVRLLRTFRLAIGSFFRRLNLISSADFGKLQYLYLSQKENTWTLYENRFRMTNRRHFEKLFGWPGFLEISLLLIVDKTAMDIYFRFLF